MNPPDAALSNSVDAANDSVIAEAIRS